MGGTGRRGHSASALACSRSSRPLRRSPIAKRGQEDGARRTAASYSSALMARIWSWISTSFPAALKLLVVVLDTSMASPELHHTRWYRSNFSDALCIRSSMSKYTRSVHGSGMPISWMAKTSTGSPFSMPKNLSGLNSGAQRAGHAGFSNTEHSTTLIPWFDAHGL